MKQNLKKHQKNDMIKAEEINYIIRKRKLYQKCINITSALFTI